jgi:hypothetical protein
MIQINCTNCKALLQIDDAFAGGVCRCRYCGTIQTVPKHLRNAAAGTGAGGNAGNGDALSEIAAGAGGAPSKTLWQKKGATIDAGSGTGLDDLAGIVASSGLSSNRLKAKAAAAKSPAAPPQKDKKTALLLTVAGGVIALLLGVIIFMAVSQRSTGNGNGNADVAQTTAGASDPASPPPPPPRAAPETPATPVTPPAPPAVAPRRVGPTFANQPLTENSVVYVIDCGAATASERRIDLLKAAVVNSVKSLGAQRKFAVFFWHTEGAKPEMFPEDGTLLQATEANATDLWRAIDHVPAYGQTKADAALERAFQINPEAIVLVPVKANLAPGFKTPLLKARAAANSNAKVHVFPVGEPDGDGVERLKGVAEETKGAYHALTMPELRAAAHGN